MPQHRRLAIAGWEITRRCNFACRHCFTSSGAPLAHELTTDECRGILDQLAALHVPIVSWSGGEPLLRDDLFELMEYGNTRGIREYTLVSNGFLVKKETLSRLRKLGMSSFQVSLDGADPEQMERIRGGGPRAFERALRAIRLAKSLGIYTVIGTFIHPWNVASLEEIVELACREGVDLMRLSGFVPIGRGEREDVIRENTLTEAQKEILARFVVDEIIGRKHGIPVLPDHAFGPFADEFSCEAGISTLYIGAAGDIYACPSLARNEFLVGSLRECTLEELWNDPKMTATHCRDAASLHGACAGCAILERCRGGCRGLTYSVLRDLAASFPNCFHDRVKALLESDRRRASPAPALPERTPPSPAGMPALFQEQLHSTFRLHAERCRHMLENPYPRYLIWEATGRCNFRCAHCATPREKHDLSLELTTAEAKRIFSAMAAEYPPAHTQMVAISGGEPMLRSDIFDMIAFLASLGYPVGLDTNAFLLGKRPELIDRLVASGLRYPCLSLDGLEESHNRLRGVRAFGEVKKALLYFALRHPDIPLQTMTVVTARNYHELPEIFALLEFLGVRRARFSTAYRAGRAPVDTMNFLDDVRLSRMLHWIAEQRRRALDGLTPLLIEFSDDGWCGRSLEGAGLEGLVRNSFFFCQAGVSMAVIHHDGALGACLSLPGALSRQGDLRTESFRDIWTQRFAPFRKREWLLNGVCVGCREWNYCLGGAMHHRGPSGELRECTFLKLENCRAERP